MVIREIYDRHFNICDYGPDSTPLKLMALHPRENTAEWSEQYQRIRQFIWLNVHKETGLSLVEFFDMPREYTDLVFRTINDKALAKGPNPLGDLDA